MRRIFSVQKKGDCEIKSWIVVHHDWRVIRFTWPWLWGRVGIEWGLPFTFYWLSEWREMTLGSTGQRGTPGYGPPPIPGKAGVWDET
jgi:hypothetical protein